MRCNCFIACIYLLVVLCGSHANGKLRASFYHKTCPNALSTIKAAVKKAVAEQKAIAAPLLRLHFHDCFVNGCDASVLLDNSSAIMGEKTAPPNKNSLQGFHVVDTIKSEVEALCSGVVSCADILAIAARDSVVELGGPTWKVRLGRRDSTTARGVDCVENLPDPNFNLSQLISSFRAKGLSTKDMVALSGAHTIGMATCRKFKRRIYSDSNINPEFATSLQGKCPCSGGDYNPSPMDLQTPVGFDNKYYKNLRSQKGLFHSDQELFNGGVTDSRVNKYSKNQKKFFKDFGRAMVKMGNIKPLTGMEGEIRKICRKPN